MKILAKYITRQTVSTLFLTLGVLTFVLLFGRLLRKLSDMLINKGVGFEAIGSLVLYLLPMVLTLSLPMAMLATTLLVFGRMSADNEITAMRASGIGITGAAAPVILVATLMGVFCLYLTTTVAPWCNFQVRTLSLQLGLQQPMALLEEQTYIKDFPGYVVYVARKKENIIEDVQLYTLDDKGQVVSSLRAQRGVVTADPVERKLKLDLHNVRGDLRDQDDPTNIRKFRPGTTAEQYPVELDIAQALKRAAQEKRLPDFQFAELLNEIRTLKERGIYPAAALLEAHQRVAAAVACIAFTMIAIPLGIKTSRRETTVGIALSLGLVSIYYAGIVLASALRNKPYLYPEAILWAPNLGFEVLGLWLLWRVSRA